MATITKFGPLRHLRAEPSQTILHFRGGRLKRRGAGLAYWFSPLSAAVAQLPLEDCATTFVVNERSADYQAVSVQVTLTYRIADPERAAARVNFSIALENGQWLDRPLDKLATFWAQRALQPARTVVTQAPLEATLQRGAEAIHAAIVAALDTDPELPAMGLKLVGVLIEKIAPSADVEKALQTPTREAIQAKADEAQYQRRALAVEKERAIKENELATQIELERQQEMLIRKAGENAMLKVEQENAAAHARASADAERLKINAAAAAEAARTAADAALEEERKRHGIWKDTPPGVLAGLVLSRFADNIQSIGHLNITPELLSQSLAQMLRDAAAPAAGGAR